MPFNRRLDKEDVVHIYNGILLSHQNDYTIFATTCTGLEEIMLSEIRSRERQLSYVSLICGIQGIAGRLVGEGREE